MKKGTLCDVYCEVPWMSQYWTSMKDGIQNGHRLKRLHNETQEFNLSAKHKYKRDRAVFRLHINTQGYVSSMWRSALSRKGGSIAILLFASCDRNQDTFQPCRPVARMRPYLPISTKFMKHCSNLLNNARIVQNYHNWLTKFEYWRGDTGLFIDKAISTQ